jgi:predicted nucleic acid-binding Zn ribbon protein
LPVYVFRCPECGGENEQLLALGDTAPRPCDTAGCIGTRTLRLSRVAVRYDAFGFSATDKLVTDTRGKDFKSLSAKAQEIADS